MNQVKEINANEMLEGQKPAEASVDTTREAVSARVGFLQNVGVAVTGVWSKVKSALHDAVGEIEVLPSKSAVVDPNLYYLGFADLDAKKQADKEAAKKREREGWI